MDYGQCVVNELLVFGIECLVYDQLIEGWKEMMFYDILVSLIVVCVVIVEIGILIFWFDVDELCLMLLVLLVYIVLFDVVNIYNIFFEVMQFEGWKDGLLINVLLIFGLLKIVDIQ